MAEIDIAAAIALLGIGFAIGYGVREAISRHRHRVIQQLKLQGPHEGGLASRHPHQRPLPPQLAVLNGSILRGSDAARKNLRANYRIGSSIVNRHPTR